MAGKTSIEWSEAVWNPAVGCTRVSAGCDNCYAFRLHDQRYAANKRAAQELGYVSAPEARRFETGALPKVLPMPEQYDRPFSMVQLLPDRLEDPLHWRKPRRVFVDSMGDLFHEEVPDAYLDRVFAVMALAPQHTFQVLTKRPERMREYVGALVDEGPERLATTAAREFVGSDADVYLLNWTSGWSRPRNMPDDGNPLDGTQPRWPLPNVWLGVSVEDQPSADARIPLLLQTPAAVRFLSCEPLLGRVDISELPKPRRIVYPLSGEVGMYTHPDGDPAPWFETGRIDWVIVGGESGPRARPCDLGWIRDIVRQCQASKVACFVKQQGSANRCAHSRHGGHFECFPPDLQLREWPEAFNGATAE